MSKRGTIVGIHKAKRSTVKARLAGRPVAVGEQCVISNEQGRLELGEVLKIIDSESKSLDWKVIRKARKKDLERFEANREDSEEALETAEELVEHEGLPMDMLGAEYSLERGQLKFYFKAPHRVDFRGLLKEMARRFSTRIELEQVGPRGAAAILGGLGRCGREFCCRRFLEDPGPIPMELAQQQELTVSPGRLTGACGRLLCCLKYECEDYIKRIREMPPIGSRVKAVEAQGTVIDHNVQKGTVKMETEDGDQLEVPNDDIEDILGESE